MCADDETRATVSLSRNTKGETWPDDLDEEALLCPGGWDCLGGSSYSAVCELSA